MNTKNNIKDQLIFGRNPIIEALKAAQSIDKIWLLKSAGGRAINEISELAQLNNVPIQRVPIEKLNRLVKGNHQGIVAITSLVTYYEVEDILADTYGQGKVPLFLICDGITDVRNIGAIARNIACTDAHALILPMRGSASINAEAIKSSAGALSKIYVCKVRFIDKLIDYLKNNGLQIVATGLTDKSISLPKVDLSIPTAIIVGAEGKGVSPKFLNMADIVTKIPMPGQFDSFNVSVATGIILYEAVRQRYC